MFGRTKVLGRMLVLGRVTATYVPADHAKAQMHPAVTHLETFFTAGGVGFHRLDLLHVLAAVHDFAFSAAFASFQGSVASDFALALGSRNPALAPRSPV